MTYTADSRHDEEPTVTHAQYVRVVVVVDWVRHRVHSITTSNEEAQQHVRELAAKYPGNWDAVTMTAWAVDVPAAKHERSSVGGTMTSSEEQAHG